jgi:hypothetical protein
MANLFDTNRVSRGRGPSDHRAGHPSGPWQSNNAHDIMVVPGTKVYSLTDGKVIKVKKNSIRSGLVYGDQVTVESTDNKFFYTHIESKVSQNQNVKKGDLIGTVVKWEDYPHQSHLHVASERGDIKNYVNFTNWAIIGSGNATNNNPENETNNDPENPPKDTTATDIEQALTRDFYQLYAPVALPTGIMGLAGENRSTQKLLEQIERIKKLM